jgi:RNA polymerase sigma-70 factor (ECF subfamily)
MPPLIAGGRDILDRAIEAYYDEIRSTVRRRGYTSTAAAEILHDLYIKLAERPERLSSVVSVRAFLTRAALNLGIDRRRREQLERKLFAGTEHEQLAVADMVPSIERVLEAEARLRQLRQAIDALPAKRRVVFLMHRIAGMTPDAIARRLGISRNMVDRHLRKALLHCLQSLSPDD